MGNPAEAVGLIGKLTPHRGRGGIKMALLKVEPIMPTKGDAFFDEGKFDEARAAYLQLLNSTNDASLQTEAAAMIARTYLTTDRKEEARPWLERARETASADQPRGYSRYLSVRGRMEWKDHQFDAAQRTFLSLYEICRLNGYAERAIDALAMLAILSPLPEQIEWAKKAIAEAERAGFSEKLGALWNNLGATLEDLGQHEAALEAYLRARDYHRQHSPALQQLKADYAVAHTQRLLSRMDEARELLLLLLPAFEEVGAEEFLGWTCQELAQVELAQENFEGARDYFIRAKSHLLDAGIATWDPATLERIVTHIARLEPRRPH
jgi:tetratricopeptide (TPR) repeat protein